MSFLWNDKSSFSVLVVPMGDGMADAPSFSDGSSGCIAFVYREIYDWSPETLWFFGVSLGDSYHCDFCLRISNDIFVSGC